ncbi:MAG: carbohydrate-binding protein [Planctomycetota bacterium]|jgi:hypothetical protein
MTISGWSVGLALVLAMSVQCLAAHHEKGEGKSPYAKKQPWGHATTAPGKILLHVKRWGEGGKISVPRLNNVVPTIGLKEDAKAKIALKPKPTHWEIWLPKNYKVKGATTVVMEVEGEVYEPIEPRVVVAGKGGVYTLYSHDAVVHGEKVCYEPLPHKNVVGFWVNQEDWVEWHLRFDAPGKYRVEIRQGCGGTGGSDVKVSLAESSLNFEVEATGGYQVFVDRDLGVLEAPLAGVFRLQVRPQVKKGNAVMDIRQMVLTPVK